MSKTREELKNNGSKPIDQGAPKFLNLNTDRTDRNIRGELEQLRRKKEFYEKFSRFVPIIGIVFFLAGLAFWYFGQGSIFFLYLGIIYLLVAITFPLFPITESVSTEIEALESELILQSTGVDAVEQRAERLFRAHEIDLKRYYQQTLRHSNIISFVGIICLIAGFAIIGFSFYLIWINPNIDLNNKLILSTYGITSGILTNFVAILYLKMFSETIKSLTVFHQKLVSTNHLHFASFLISKISNDADRDKANFEIASHIVRGEGAKNDGK